MIMHALRLTAAALVLSASTSALGQSADRIWTGGTILTMEDEAMRVEAIAEDDGKIIAVGPRAEVMKRKGPRTEVIDLKGRTLLPGFVDAHGHIFLGGLQALSANMLAAPDGEVTDIASMIRTLKEWRTANAAAVEKGKLIIGFGYDNAQLKELRHPTKEELDQVSTDLPVIVVHQSGHIVSVNSKMLEMMGVTADSKDPAGGVIQRKPGTTEPNGTLEESAMFPMLGILFKSVGTDGLKLFAQEGAKLWAQFGYTTAQEGRADPTVSKLIAEVGAAGGFQNDIAVYPDVMVDRQFIKDNQSREYVGRVRIAGGKLSLDGSPQGFTAWRDKPYYDPVGNYPEGYSGYPAFTAEQVYSAIGWAAENNVQLLTHANGERASDMLISALTAAAGRFPQVREQRPVLIHGQFMREDQVDSYKQLGVIPSLFPMHTFYWGDWHLEHTVGPEAGQNISPTGWVRKRGMIFTTHHDAPVAFPDSMRVLDATVTRRSRGKQQIVGPQHRVDVITGLKAMTIWPAYQHFEEATKGSLKVGKLADFVILSADPTAVDPETIDQIKVTETIKEGRSIYQMPKGKRAEMAPANIAPLLLMLDGGGNTHTHADGRECPGEAAMALASLMTSGAIGQ
jgi:predicted amidohydrolase YtcJ